MIKWYFPFGKDIEKESVFNARIETFKDNILESLTREICQNSLDASNNSGKPVRVSFQQKLVDIEQIPDRDSFKNNIIPWSLKTWENDNNASEFLDYYEELLQQEQIKVLQISDYNTTGLMAENWESLVENAGTSVKADISSAGSFGIGKAAPFASSDLRMVFYSTKLQDGDEKSIGVTKFISFDIPDGMTAQGVGYIGRKEKKPLERQISFGFDKRTKCGTDIYVIAFNQDDNWKEIMIGSIFENFLISIFKEKLVVDIEDIVINKDTMKKKISQLDDKRYRQLKNYYSVLIDENVKKIHLDERFKEFGFNEKDGMLLLSKGDKANRSVLMTRKAGMKILDRKSIHGSIQFNGIFQAKGEKFNEILKGLENPNHKDWIASRYTKDPNMANKLLDAIYRFMKDNVIEHYQEKIDETVDAFGIKDFLPNNLSNDKDEESNDKENSSLKINLEEAVLKPRDLQGISSDSINGDDIEREMVRSGIVEGEETGPGTPKDSETNGKGGGNSGGTGRPGGDNKEDPDGKKTILEKEEQFKKSNKFTARIVELNYKMGEYRLILTGETHSDKLKVQINLVSETGSNYKDNLETAYSHGEELIVKKDYCILENPQKKSNIIDFKVSHENRLRMGVTIYENKR